MQLGELAGTEGKLLSPSTSLPCPPPFLSLLPPAIREIHAQKDCLILAQTFSCGNYQQVAEPGGPGRLQLGCLGKMGREKPGVTVAQRTLLPPPLPDTQPGLEQTCHLLPLHPSLSSQIPDQWLQSSGSQLWDLMVQ